jgi:hypothetical protein
MCAMWPDEPDSETTIRAVALAFERLCAKGEL